MNFIGYMAWKNGYLVLLRLLLLIFGYLLHHKASEEESKQRNDKASEEESKQHNDNASEENKASNENSVQGLDAACSLPLSLKLNWQAVMYAIQHHMPPICLLDIIVKWVYWLHGLLKANYWL